MIDPEGGRQAADGEPVPSQGAGRRGRPPLRASRLRGRF